MQLRVSKDCLAGTKPWVLSPVRHKLGMMSHAYNPSTQETDARGSQIQGDPQLCRAQHRSVQTLSSKQHKVVPGSFMSPLAQAGTSVVIVWL